MREETGGLQLIHVQLTHPPALTSPGPRSALETCSNLEPWLCFESLVSSRLGIGNVTIVSFRSQAGGLKYVNLRTPLQAYLQAFVLFCFVFNGDWSLLEESKEAVQGGILFSSCVSLNTTCAPRGERRGSLRAQIPARV